MEFKHIYKIMCFYKLISPFLIKTYLLLLLVWVVLFFVFFQYWFILSLSLFCVGIVFLGLMINDIYSIKKSHASYLLKVLPYYIDYIQTIKSCLKDNESLIIKNPDGNFRFDKNDNILRMRWFMNDDEQDEIIKEEQERLKKYRSSCIHTKGNGEYSPVKFDRILSFDLDTEYKPTIIEDFLKYNKKYKLVEELVLYSVNNKEKELKYKEEEKQRSIKKEKELLNLVKENTLVRPSQAPDNLVIPK